MHRDIHAGTRHLRAMMVRFRSDLPLAIAAYNAARGRSSRTAESRRIRNP